MDRKHLFRNLMVVASIDGKITEEEITFLSLRASRWGLTEAEFQADVAYARSPNAELVIPPGKQDRVELLQNMVRMMAIDGEISDVERTLFAVVAARMEISTAELNRLIDSVTKGT
jgi:uncharacterized tellurite resistance protein B-like protein